MSIQALAAQAQANGGVVDNGDEFIVEFLGPEACEDVERRTALYDDIAKDFSTQVGKTESRRERNERGLKEI